MTHVSCWHEAADATGETENPEIKQAYTVLVCVYTQPFCVCKRPFCEAKKLLRKSFVWRGEISRKTLHLFSSATDIPDQTCALRNETRKRLSVSVILYQGKPVCRRHLTTQARVRPQVVPCGICVKRSSNRTVSLQVLPFPLPVSSHQCSTLIFIYKLLLPEGQSGEVGEPPKNQNYIRESWIDKHFHLKKTKTDRQSLESV